MTLQQLTYFLAAMRHGSFSAAADALYLAQPSLSEQVRRLEEELGVSLFVRGSAGLAVTEAGRALRPHAEAALAAVEHAREAVVASRELRAGTASLGCFGTVPHYGLGRVVAEFRRRHPQVAVRLVGENSSQVVEAVREGRLEAGVIVLPVDDRGLEIERLRREEVVFVTADPERARRPVTTRQLAQEPLILYDARFGPEDPTRRQLVERAQREGVTLSPVIEVELIEGALQLACRGLGGTIASRELIARSRHARALHTASFAEPLYDDFAIVTRQGGHLSPATRALLALARARLF